ncbi:integrase catalytic domain-containing protein [Trichonephila clavipes]|nr:integrase catalytic domain-containing protein [Trichonephila clavipes]
MPRLELCATVLLEKLMKRVETALQMKTSTVYLWSDSTINPVDLVSRGRPILSSQKLFVVKWTYAFSDEIFSGKEYPFIRVTDSDEFNGEFKGANAELKRLHKLVINPDPELAGFLVDENINWNSRFTYEEFLTIMTQIEGILNSGPLTPLSTDIDDLPVLTPAHFLIGRPITSISEPNIIHRSKWKFEKDNARVGDLVLIKEDNFAVSKWLMGRLIEVFPGKDNRIRVVTIKTQYGVVKRPISKICILPLIE